MLPNVVVVSGWRNKISVSVSAKMKYTQTSVQHTKDLKQTVTQQRNLKAVMPGPQKNG